MKDALKKKKKFKHNSNNNKMTNNMEHLFNLTNNPEVNSLIGNFVKVVNTNLEESIKNVKKKRW